MKVAVPFLGGIVCEVRNYKCKFMKVCPHTEPENRTKAHYTVQEKDFREIERVRCESPREILKRRVLEIYSEICKRTQFCRFQVIERVGNRVTAKFCDGGPVVRTAKSTGKLFVGCTGYFENSNGTSLHPLRHYYRTLDCLDEGSVQIFKGLLNGDQPPSLPIDKCKFVLGKNRRGSSKYDIHQVTLVDVCRFDHRMTIVQPYIEDSSPLDASQNDAYRGICYVICQGAHTHMPPHPPMTTVRNMSLLAMEKEADPAASIALLKHRVQARICESVEAGEIKNVQLC